MSGLQRKRGKWENTVVIQPANTYVCQYTEHNQILLLIFISLELIFFLRPPF